MLCSRLSKSSGFGKQSGQKIRRFSSDAVHARGVWGCSPSTLRHLVEHSSERGVPTLFQRKAENYLQGSQQFRRVERKESCTETISRLAGSSKCRPASCSGWKSDGFQHFQAPSNETRMMQPLSKRTLRTARDTDISRIPAIRMAAFTNTEAAVRAALPRLGILTSVCIFASLCSRGRQNAHLHNALSPRMLHPKHRLNSIS